MPHDPLDFALPINQPPPNSAADLVSRLKRQRRTLGPKNSSGLLHDESIAAVIDLARQLHEAVEALKHLQNIYQERERMLFEKSRAAEG